MKIRNKEQLTRVGDVESRKIVLNILEGILEELDAHSRLLQMIRRDGEILRIGEKQVDLKKFKNIYAFSAGKAANHMARAFEDLLGDYLTKGVTIVKVLEDADTFRNTEVFVGGHPLPNTEGAEGSRRMIEIAQTMTEDDLLLLGLSGGTSALMSYPVDGITIEDLRQATDIMLKSGMWVMDINDVRGHLCRMSRGGLGRHIQAGEILCFEIWDAVGMADQDDYTKPVPIIGTPVGHDWVTFKDIYGILSNYSIFSQMPKSIQKLILEADPAKETPKQSRHVDYYIVNTIPDSCRIGERLATEKGISCHVLTTYTEGESKDFGTFLGSIAKEILTAKRPFLPPVLLLSAGETTTFIPDSSVIKGHGGPSQEMAASFALIAEQIPGACLLSVDSEGTDGTTPMAGAVTDSTTLRRAREKGIDLREALRSHATYEALSQLDDCIFTGNTGTNLCDINLLYIPAGGGEIGHHD